MVRNLGKGKIMKKKVKNISGMFWASDLLNGHLPLPQKQNKKLKETEFQSMLETEIKLLNSKEERK
jgi:hypothetical protein